MRKKEINKSSNKQMTSRYVMFESRTFGVFINMDVITSIQSF